MRTDARDFTAQRHALAALGVGEDRVYVEHGLTGTNRKRPRLRQALAACRAGDTLVVTNGDKDRVWRIPASAFEAQGLTEQPPWPASEDATVTPHLADLRRTLQGLTGTLRIERQHLANKERELQDAMLQIGQLRRDLKYERTRREEDAEAQAARLRAPAVDLTAAEQVKGPSERVIDLTGVDRFALEAERRRREGD